MKPDRRQRGRDSFHRGQRAEWLAALWLGLRGYWPVAWRYRTPVGEIDLVCQHHQCLVFVEVKNRPDIGTASGAISPQARRRIMRAAEYFMASRPQAQRQNVRFDAVLVVPGRWPYHIKNAWFAEE